MNNRKEKFKKQDKELINTLITIAESSSNISLEPKRDKTVKRLLFEALTNNPYKYTQSELFIEVHENIRGKKNLKLETYKLQRSELCKTLGWGIHGDEQGKLSLISCNSKEYGDLLTNRNIKKKKAYNKHRKNLN